MYNPLIIGLISQLWFIFPTIGYNYGEITHNNTISSNNPLNGGEKPFMGFISPITTVTIWFIGDIFL
jgi:hypothetical protein